MFNSAQRIAIRSYAGGEFSHVLQDERYWDPHLDEIGDPLFTALVRDLADVGPGFGVNRLGRMIHKLEDVQTALLNSGNDRVAA